MPKIFLKARDPISSYSHFLAAGLSIAGLVAVIVQLVRHNASALTATAALVFCCSLIALYCSSGFYHFPKAQRIVTVLRRLDHAMIYVLIAGTYTPILLTFLPLRRGVLFTAIIWTVAVIGIALKLCWMGAPRWLGTSLYIALGWAILADVSAITAMPVPARWTLFVGGLLYTIGGVIYALKKPNFSKTFGFHELFHLFVIGGSLCHYWMILFYVV